MTLNIDADPENGRPALLLVHGMLSSRNHWRPNLCLSREFRIIRIDLPAHGLSPAPNSEVDATPEALVMAIEAVRERLQISRWHICGQSFGAALTLRYALTFPDRVIAQVFTNANGALREAWDVSQQRQNLKQIEEILRERHVALRRMAYHPCHAKRFPPDLRELLSQDADSSDIRGIVMLLAQATPHLSVRGRLGELRVPTLLINGAWEKRFQNARNWLRHSHPNIAIKDLPGGHSINIECPDGFNTAVLLFLAEHR